MNYPHLSEIFNVTRLYEALEVVFMDKGHGAYIDSSSPLCTYGTAGFRTKGHLLSPVVFRVPFVTTLRSIYLRCLAVATNTTKESKIGCSHGPTCFKGVNPSSVGDLGLMITASHNPSDDNGLKIVDADGGMLEMCWEEPATVVCNEGAVGDFLRALEELLADKCVNSIHLAEEFEGIPQHKIIPYLLEKEAEAVGNLRHSIRLHVGRDTRPSGEQLFALVHSAIKIIQSTLLIDSTPLEIHDHGVVSTPILHAMVYWNRYKDTPLLMEGFRLLNCNTMIQENAIISPSTYRDVILNAFNFLSSSFSIGSPRTIIVDCANGVGATVLSELLSLTGGKIGSIPQYEFVSVHDNTSCPSLLNKECGADFAQKTKQAPPAFMKLLLEKLKCEQENESSSVVKDGKVSTNEVSRRYGFYCLDGDADRVVSFVPIPKNDLGSSILNTTPIPLSKFEEEVTFELLDGDRISVLFASLLQKLNTTSNTSYCSSLQSAKVGVVQTAYANGASTNYINRSLKLQTHCVATGVKHLHPKAEDMYIGIYFEANGHGTMLLSNKIFDPVPPATDPRATRDGSHGDPTTNKEGILSLRDTFLALRMLLSQCCGDAIADFLACELSFNVLGWNRYLGSDAVMATKWHQLYSDLPSITDKVTVSDPLIIKNTSDQRRVTYPVALQDAIDAIVSKYAVDQQCRSFVRPSGTEPIVRIYTEGVTSDIAREVFEGVAKALIEICR